MKILLLVPAMDLGGVEQGAYDLAVGFRTRGHQATVISGPGRLVTRLRKRDVAWHRLTLDRKNPLAFLSSVVRLRRILARERPDIVHARSRLPAWTAWFALPASPGSRFVTSVHGFHGNRRYSRVLGRGERVIVVSEALHAHAVDFLGADPNRVRVVYNGFDPAPFRSLPEKTARQAGGRTATTIGAVGRLTASRDYPELLEALALLKDDHDALNMIIVGNGPREKDLRNRCARLNITDRVVFARGAQVDFLGRFDIMAAPFSQPEKRLPGKIFWPGRSAAEAQAAGIPVIVTAADVPPGTFAPGRDCLFVPPRDARAMAAAIRFLLDHPAEKKAMVERARANALKHFSLSAMVEKTLAVYSELAPTPAD